MPARLRFVLPFFFAVVLISCGDSDADKQACLPISILRFSDSISYQYDANRRLTSILYLSKKGSIFAREDYTFNGNRLTGGTYRGTSSPGADRTWTLEYGSDGNPSRLVSWMDNQADVKTTTEFVHNSKGSLTKGTTRISVPGFPDPIYVGGYIYEYNDKGNVTTVKYVVSNGLGGTKEVLARENVTFDDKPQFYAASAELKTVNVYLYRYIPNANNCLASNIYYTDYNSSYVQMVPIVFTTAYDEGGRVTKLDTNSPFSIPTYGESLYYNGRYECR